VNSTAPATRPRTPWHLWVVGILALLWDGMGALDYLMTQTKNSAYMGQFTPEQLAYFYGFPAWVVSGWAIAVWGGVFGSLLLLLRRAVALWVYVVSLVGLLVTMFYEFVLTNGAQVIGGVGPLLFTGAIFLVAALLVVYAAALKRRGVLT